MARALLGKKVGVVGLGKSGLAAARVLVREGAIVSAADEKAELGAVGEALAALGVAVHAGPLDPGLFASQALVVTSPGVPLSHPAFKAARGAGVPIIGELELAAGLLTEPLLAITGTNGKSTTTALTGHLCATAGLRTFTGGNLGQPLSEHVLEPAGDVPACAASVPACAASVSVVECSSFQLESIERFHPRGAAFLNLTPDHLDRYPDNAAYGAAKARIFMNQVAGDFAVVNAHDPEVMRLSEGIAATHYTFGRGAPVPFGIRDDGEHLVLRLSDDAAVERYAIENRALRGAHNRENAMAAILLARTFGVPADAVRAGLHTFGGLAHRMESVRTLDGVEWVNDSKATNVESTVVALRAFETGVVLIAGGHGKGAPYAPLVALGPGRIRAVLTVGEDAPAIEQAFSGVVPVVTCRTLEVAVQRAHALARPGNTVLLSPACSSYDQFKNFEERGARFAALVAKL